MPAAIAWAARCSPSPRRPWRATATSGLATVTMLAAQTDFTEAGELQLFTDESQLALLDDVMWKQGYLDTTQMAGAFQMLRSNDLIWSRLIKTYQLGEREQSPTTSWPGMRTRHGCRSACIRNICTTCSCATTWPRAAIRVEGQPDRDFRDPMPIFGVSTETDHVAPWRSVYKIHLLNAGRYHLRAHLRRPQCRHRQRTRSSRDGISASPIAAGPAPYVAPEDWAAAAEENEGSWWPLYGRMACRHSGEPIAPAAAWCHGYKPLCDAPGTYVRES